MVYLRSEEHLQRWLDANGYEGGASLPAAQMNDLARRFWWTRLDPDWEPRSPEDSQAILAEVGLTSEFWALR
ncbi:MAG: hypothetical protein ACRDPV_12265 [Gaiellaceae bacterium]